MLFRSVSSILSDTSISLADYYRLIRNTELHASTPEEKVTSPQEFYKTLPIEKIESEYKRKPSVFNQLTFDDVLLCSMALQNIVKALSSGLLSNEMIATLLQKSFGNLDKNRRINAATEFCRQDLLLEQFQIKEVFESLGWLA